ncbi:hypothetical protein A2U01_0012882, partial [Trifolium medium]|nr:hypothetical protein [Trifolium medium]
MVASYLQKQCFAAVLSASKEKAAGCHKALVRLQELGVQRVNIEGD